MKLTAIATACIMAASGAAAQTAAETLNNALKDFDPQQVMEDAHERRIAQMSGVPNCDWERDAEGTANENAAALIDPVSIYIGQLTAQEDYVDPEHVFSAWDAFLKALIEWAGATDRLMTCYEERDYVLQLKLMTADGEAHAREFFGNLGPEK